MFLAPLKIENCSRSERRSGLHGGIAFRLQQPLQPLFVDDPALAAEPGAGNIDILDIGRLDIGQSLADEGAKLRRAGRDLAQTKTLTGDHQLLDAGRFADDPDLGPGQDQVDQLFLIGDETLQAAMARREQHTLRPGLTDRPEPRDGFDQKMAEMAEIDAAPHVAAVQMGGHLGYFGQGTGQADAAAPCRGLFDIAIGPDPGGIGMGFRRADHSVPDRPQLGRPSTFRKGFRDHQKISTSC